MNTPQRANRLLAWQLAAGALAMSGLGLAAVPLYRSVCLGTGLSGATAHIDYSAALAHQADGARWVTVEFVTNTVGALPWEFRPTVERIQVHPGELVTTHFRARNRGQDAMLGQAVPSVTPGLAAPYFYSVGGICETKQPLAAGEAKDMPMQFVVDARLPPTVGTLTLSVAFFAAPGRSAATLASSRPL